MIYTSVLENYELDNQINCLMNEIIEESNIVLEDSNEEEKKTKLGEKIKKAFITAGQKILNLIRNIIRFIKEFLRKAKQVLLHPISIKIKITNKTIPVKYAVIKDDKGNEIDDNQFKNYIANICKLNAECIDNFINCTNLVKDNLSQYLSSPISNINKEKIEELIDKISNLVNKDITKYDVNTEVYSAFDMDDFEKYNKINTKYFDMIDENYFKYIDQKMEKLGKCQEEYLAVSKKIGYETDLAFADKEERESFISIQQNYGSICAKTIKYIKDNHNYFINIIDKLIANYENNESTVEELKK